MLLAKLRYLKIAPRKTRLVADLIRNLSVAKAMEQLEHLPKKAAGPFLKLLKSAMANAENNFKVKPENLIIKELRVDGGPAQKRWMPRAFGHATPLMKHTSHITLILSDKTNPQAGEQKKKEKLAKKTPDADVTIVKDLSAVKKLAAEEKVANASKNIAGEDHEPHLKDIKDLSLKNEGKDKIKGAKKGALKKMFQRKSIG